MDASRWLDAFMASPWYEKAFWLFFAGVITWITWMWIKVIVDAVRFERSPRRGSVRAKSAGAGFGESVTTDVGMASASLDSGSGSGSSELASGDTGGGSDFSGGGGESGGGGSSGSWS